MTALRIVLFMLLVRPFLMLWLGLRSRNRRRLCLRGPAIVVANHNSHLDTLVLMSLFRARDLKKLRPAAAADHFFRHNWLSWILARMLGVIPVSRVARKAKPHPMLRCIHALADGQIVILYPEGTRGAPERLAELKPGVAHLARRFPNVPVIPVFLSGLGTAMPKGRAFPALGSCSAVVGQALYWDGSLRGFMHDLECHLARLANEALPADRLSTIHE